MCGIIGYIGRRNAEDTLLEGLKRLEYRGYDSAGIAIIQNKNLAAEKAVGRIANLEEKLRGKNLNGEAGISHTRWATHGKPTEKNAHPHLSCDSKFAVVHNGIIENYQRLRDGLKKKGHKFVSETDSETLSHLIENFYLGDLSKKP